MALSAGYIGYKLIFKQERQKWWSIAIENYRLCFELNSNQLSPLINWACLLADMALMEKDESKKYYFLSKMRKNFSKLQS